ncbi:MAG: TIGR01777 family oxidoreductase [Micrococcales bacterium]
MRVLIAGASGLIGHELISQLKARGDEPVALVRRKPSTPAEIEWNPAVGELDPTVISGFDAVVNLSGASIGKLPWNASYERELVESRISATRTLVDAINQATTMPAVFISGSASGYYGDAGDTILNEDSKAGTGFLADLCIKWEAEAERVDTSVRLVKIRTAVVFSKTGGALSRVLPLVRLGAGGPLGNGRQWWPWISITDEAAAIVHLLHTDSARGAFNLCAPESATCGTLIAAMASALKRPFGLPAPAFALRLLLGKAADEVLLSSQRMSSAKLVASGFKFEHPTVTEVAGWVTQN